MLFRSVHYLVTGEARIGDTVEVHSGEQTITLTVVAFARDAQKLSAPVRVPGCLWAPGAPADLGTDRPEGASVTATAHLPRGHGLSLRGGRVSLDGRDWLDVVGDPRPYPPGTVRGPWDTRVELGRQDG